MAMPLLLQKDMRTQLRHGYTMLAVLESMGLLQKRPLLLPPSGYMGAGGDCRTKGLQRRHLVALVSLSSSVLDLSVKFFSPALMCLNWVLKVI